MTMVLEFKTRLSGAYLSASEFRQRRGGGVGGGQKRIEIGDSINFGINNSNLQQRQPTSLQLQPVV